VWYAPAGLPLSLPAATPARAAGEGGTAREKVPNVRDAALFYDDDSILPFFGPTIKDCELYA
jgi:hypothetical protein